MKKDMDLGPLEILPDPEADRRAAERVELMRVASVRALELHEAIQHLDDEALAAAKHWAAMPALLAPLSDGAPSRETGPSWRDYRRQATHVAGGEENVAVGPVQCEAKDER